VHIQRRLGQNECAGIRDSGVVKVATGQILELSKDGVVDSIGSSNILGNSGATKVGLIVGVLGTIPVSSETRGDIIVKSTGILEQTTGINEGTGISSDGSGASESVDSVGESINGISVVEGLGTENLEQESITDQRRAIVNVLIRLNNPDQLLNGVIEVELDLIGRRTNGLITSELELGDQILVGVLGESSALVSVQEHIVNVQRGSDQRLVIGDGSRDGLTGVVLVGSISRRGLASSSGGVGNGTRVARQGSNSPQALINRADIKVDLDLVVLESNQRESQTGVGTKPKLERDVKGGLRKGVSGRANLAGSQRVARAINLRERGIGDEGKLGDVTNHLEVATLLLSSHCELIPDVHPVTILTVNSLTTNLNLNLSNDLLTGEVQPTSINTRSGVNGKGSSAHKLVDLGESHLQIGSVSKVTVSGDDALDSASKIGLTVESLLNRLDGKVSISSVSDLPEGDLRITCTFPLPYLSIRIRLYLKMNLLRFFLIYLKLIPYLI
jgi:hypothetical protein